MKSETQSYVLKKGYLLALYPGSTALAYGTATIYNIDPTQLYSNSGNSYLYKMNVCYNDSNHLHPFEIQGITGPTTNVPECSGLTGGSICITVPPSSFGYIEVPFYIAPREGLILMDTQIEIYPNPTANSFNIACTIPEELINDFEVNIFDLNGKILLQTKTTQHADIDVSTLPANIYFVTISNPQKCFLITKKLIKTE